MWIGVLWAGLRTTHVGGQISPWPASKVTARVLLPPPQRAQDIRCWYVWTPSTIDTAYYDLQLGNLDDVCPGWRTKNAYLVVMFLLSQKKRVSKSST